MAEKNSISILTDMPEFEEPTKEFRRLSEIISNIINGSNPEFTIGIYGKWGTGKTTLMRHVQNRIESSEYELPTIWFNAWRYEREQVLATMPLVAVILDALTKELEKKTNLEEVSQDNKTKAKRILIKIGKAFVKGSSVSVQTGIGGNGIEYTFDPSKIIEEQESEESSIQESIPPLHKGINLIGNMLSALDNKNKVKLVVFIDDLDRCSPDTTMEVFESVKILLNMKGIIHVMGLSKETIDNLIKEKFKTQEINSDEYVQKIIQLPIFIPDWKSKNIKSIITKNILDKLGEDSIYYSLIKDREELLTLVAKSNPREAKRIVNQFIVDYEFTKLSYPEIFNDSDKEELDKKRFSIFVISLLRILDVKEIVDTLAKEDSDSKILLEMIKEISNSKTEDDFKSLVTKWSAKTTQKEENEDV